MLELVRLLPAPVVVTGPEGSVRYLSEEAAGLLDLDPGTVPGAIPVDVGLLLPGITLPPEAGGDSISELDLAAASGSPRHLRARARRCGSGPEAPVVISLLDLTAEVAADRQTDLIRWILAESEQIGRFATWRWDAVRDELTWSDQLFRLFGLEPGVFQPTMARFFEFIHPEDRTRTRARIERALEGTAPPRHRVRALREDGSAFRLELEGKILRDSSGRVQEVRGIVFDATSRREAELDHARLQALMEWSFDGVILKDADDRVVAANSAAERIYGLEARDAIGRLPAELLSGAESREIDVLMERLAAGESDGMSIETVRTRPDGSRCDVSVSLAAVRDSGMELAGTVTVVRELAQSGEESGDPGEPGPDRLTGLAGHGLFMERMPELLRRGAGALLRMDLDNMRLVNDHYGFAAGDRILRGIARTIRECCAESWLPARLGGDEFAVLMPGASRQEAEGIADQILRRVRGHVEPVDGNGVTVTASIGIAMFEAADDPGVGGVLSRADRALYRAKQSRDAWILADDAAGRSRPDPRGGNWEHRIREILGEDGIVLHLQPITDLGSSETVMYEVLMRIDEDGESQAPGAFLDMAERLGLIHEIDRAVMRKALDLLEARPGLNLSVNMSGKSLGDGQLLEMIGDAIALHRFDPSGLVIELTETAAALERERARSFASRLRELGCGFAIDDFGTGFGAFSYLKNLPADYLKIDGEFVQEWTTVDELVVNSMVDLARGLGKKTVAEGVETEESLRRLAGAGVDLAQGFHIGRPVPVGQALGAGA